MSAPEVSALVIGVAATIKVGALAVAAVSTVTHDGASVVHAGDVPPAMHPAIDGHSTLGVD